MPFDTLSQCLCALQTFTQALYDLAAHPEYAQPMRDEVDAIVEEEGWTKNSMSKMRKIDSFLRESQRFHGLSSCAFLVPCWQSSIS